MMIREATPADDAALVALWAACYPFRVVTAASVAAEREQALPGERQFAVVAELGGRVVGFARNRVDLESQVSDVAGTVVMVAPEHRRAGIGRALHGRIAAYQRSIGVRRTVVRVFGDDGRAFALRNGLASNRVERISRVDPREVAEPAPLPADLTVRSFAEVTDMHAVYDLDCAVSADVPTDTPFKPFPFEQWRTAILGTPLFDPDCSVIAYAGEVPVALACSEVASPRMFSGLAGTLAEYRGRGIAGALKAHALRRAAGKGVTEAFTNNDDGNRAMLAVNTRLGYREHARVEVFLGEL